MKFLDKKYEKKRDISHVRHKKNFLSAAKNEVERKEMLGEGNKWN